MIARAQGNPLFIEELSYGLLESGMAVVNSGTCTLPPNFVSADVPSSMEGLINSRMDLLPLSTQTLAKVGTFCHCFRVRYCQYDSHSLGSLIIITIIVVVVVVLVASVIGYEFPLGMLRVVYVCDITIEQLREDAKLLQNRNFLSGSGDEYSFKNEKICTVLLLLSQMLMLVRHFNSLELTRTHSFTWYSNGTGGVLEIIDHTTTYDPSQRCHVVRGTLAARGEHRGRYSTRLPLEQGSRRRSQSGGG